MRTAILGIAAVASLCIAIWAAGCAGASGAKIAVIAAQRLVSAHCKVPRLVRQAERAVIAQAISPNSIQVNCTSDD